MGGPGIWPSLSRSELARDAQRPQETPRDSQRFIGTPSSQHWKGGGGASELARDQRLPETHRDSPRLPALNIAGGSQEEPAEAPGVSRSFQEDLGRLSGDSQETLRRLSGVSPETLRRLSANSQETLRRVGALGASQAPHIYPKSIEKAL